MQPTNNNSITNENWAWTTCGHQGRRHPVAGQQHSLTSVPGLLLATSSRVPPQHPARLATRQQVRCQLPATRTPPSLCEEQQDAESKREPKQTVCTCRSKPHVTKAAGANSHGRTTSICECWSLPFLFQPTKSFLRRRNKAAYPHALQLHVKTHTHKIPP